MNKDNMENKNRIQNVRDSLAIFGSLVGLLLAVLWLAGRQFAQGYFSAMNIPAYYIKLTTWDYAELSWSFLVLGSIVLVFILSIFLAYSRLLIHLLLNIIKSLIEWIYSCPKISNKELTESQENTKSQLLRSLKTIGTSIYILLLGLIFVLVLIKSLLFIKSLGVGSGQRSVFNNSPKIEILSEIPLNLSNQSQISYGNSSVYLYKRYHLLIVNNGNYFVFKEIDKNTCKPKEVYVINEKNILQLNLAIPSELPACFPKIP